MGLWDFFQGNELHVTEEKVFSFSLDSYFVFVLVIYCEASRLVSYLLYFSIAYQPNYPIKCSE